MADGDFLFLLYSFSLNIIDCPITLVDFFGSTWNTSIKTESRFKFDQRNSVVMITNRYIVLTDFQGKF